jgi:hypothetical protein
MSRLRFCADHSRRRVHRATASAAALVLALLAGASARAADDEPALTVLGTRIGAADRFAVVQMADRAVVTVHEGDELAGYAVAAIARDGIEIRSRASGRRMVVRLDAPRPPAVTTVRVDESGFEPHPYTGPITQGVQVDQSLPAHPVRGPTASLPPGVRQVGH